MADIETLLAKIIDTETAIKRLEIQRQELRDALEVRLQDGDLDPSFSWNDWSFSHSEGKRSYTYPPTITDLEATIKAEKAAAIADGTAIEKRGAPFWTIKPPASR